MVADVSGEFSRLSVLRILVASVVDPSDVGGGGSALRGLLDVLESVGADVRCSAGWPRSSGFGSGRVASFMHSLASSRPSKAFFQESLRKPFRKALESEGPWDAVLFFGADLLDFADLLPASTPRMLVAINLEYELFEQQIESLGWTTPGVRWLLDRDAAKLRRFEEEGMRGFATFSSSRRGTVVPPGSRVSISTR